MHAGCGGCRETSTTLRVELAGHGMNIPTAGQPTCEGDRCVVTTTAPLKMRTWTWVFAEPNIATIRGDFPYGGEGDDEIVDFDEALKRGCPGPW
jgi:hypothetical protein